MKLLLTILACLVAASAGAQTIKSLGFNTTNGVVPTTALSNLPLTFTNTGGISCSSFDSGNVLMGSNTITFYGTNSGLAFSAGANASQVRNQIGLGATWLTNTDVTNFRTAIGLGATNTVAFDTIQIQSDIFTPALEASDGTNYVVLTASEISFQGVAGPQTRTNLGLGATNNVTFSNITATGTLAVSNTATFSTNVSVAGSLSVGSFTTTTPSTWALDATQTAAATNGRLTLPSNANVIRLTNNNAISSVTNGVLGAFYYLVNQATNAVTISNVGGITIDGAQNLTLSPNESATLVATGPTNVSVANRGDLTDVALGGTANTAPSQTASSGASLMTRELSDARYSFSRWYDANDLLSGAQNVGVNPLITGNGSGHIVNAILVTLSNNNTKFMLPVDYRVSGSVKVVSYWTDRTLTNSGTNGDIAVWTFPFVASPTNNMPATPNAGLTLGTSTQNTFTANYAGGTNSRFYVMEQTLNFATVTNISATNPMQLKWVELQRRGNDATDTSSDSIFLSGVHIYVP
jgi:hypothetical protein